MSTIKQGTLDPKSHLYYAPRWVRERAGEDETEQEPPLNETPEVIPVEQLPRHVSPPLDDHLPNGVRRLLEPEADFASMADTRRVARRSLALAIAALAVSAAGVVAALLLLQSVGSLKGERSILAAVVSKLSLAAPLNTPALARTELPPQEMAPLAPAPAKEPDAAPIQPPPAVTTARIEPAAVQAPAVQAIAPAAEVQAPAVDTAKIEPKPVPAARVIDLDQVAALMKRADALIASGDLPAARLILQWIAETHNGHAAYELGMTYDPAFIKRLGAVSIVPDLPRARTWYERAQDWGSPEASQRLQSLAADDTTAALGK
jgi:hypothetical protein